MRKYHYFILSLLVLLSVSSCNTNNPVFEPQEQLIKTEMKWLIHNETESKIEKVSFKKYDISGNLLINEQFDENGNLTIRIEFDYSDYSMIESITTFEGGRAVSLNRNSYSFDKDGKLIEKIYLNEDGDTSSISRYKYDSRGNILEELKYDINGELTDKVAFQYNYNTEGFLISRTINDGLNGSFKSRDTIIYHQNRNSVERIYFNSKGDKEWILTFIYNSRGLIKKEIHSEQTGRIIRKYLYEYTFF